MKNEDIVSKDTNAILTSFLQSKSTR